MSDGNETFRFAMRGCVVLSLWLWLCAAAYAHASLVGAQPEDGAVVAIAPTVFALTFNEPVSPLSLSLVSPDGSSTRLERFGLSGGKLEIPAPPDLGRGTHILSWRVVSDDGHPVGGSLVFSIGAPGATPPIVENVIRWPMRGGLWVGKVALYVGLFIGVGGAFANVWLLRSRMQARGVILAAMAAGLFGTIVSTGFQGLDALDASIIRLADPIVWETGAGTSFGRTACVAILALGAAAFSVFTGGTVARALSLAALLMVGIALSLSGHASAAQPQWLMRMAVFVHGSAIAFWAGALVPLGMALRRQSPQALPALRQFSTGIPYVVAMLVVAGIVLSVVQVGEPAALIETAYGRVLIVKLMLVAMLFLLAAVNRWSLTAPTQAGDRDASRRLVRSIAVETIVLLLILCVAAMWRFTPPPRALAAAAAMPVSVHMHAAEAMAEVTIAPGRAGPVDASISITTEESEPLDPAEVTLVLANPAAGIEPIRRPASRSEDGTWRVDKLVLPVSGAWTIGVDILIDSFKMTRLKTDITIRP